MKNKKIQKSKGKKTFFDNKLLLQAVTILQKQKQKEISNSKDLLEISSNPFIYMNVVLNKLPVIDHKRMRHIELKNSIYGQDNNSNFLFIVSNEFKKNNKETLKLFLPTWKFVSYEKLTKSITQYKDKKNLMKSFDLFFCERRIAPLLKTHLGKIFYEKKKFPYPVCFEDFEETGKFSKDKLQQLLEKLGEKSSYLHIGNGVELTLKIGRIKMQKIEILKNILKAVKNLLLLFKDLGLEKQNIRRIYLKNDQSESLPVFTQLTPEEILLAKEILEENGNEN